MDHLESTKLEEHMQRQRDTLQLETIAGGPTIPLPYFQRGNTVALPD